METTTRKSIPLIICPTAEQSRILAEHVEMYHFARNKFLTIIQQHKTFDPHEILQIAELDTYSQTPAIQHLLKNALDEAISTSSNLDGEYPAQEYVARFTYNHDYSIDSTGNVTPNHAPRENHYPDKMGRHPHPLPVPNPPQHPTEAAR